MGHIPCREFNYSKVKEGSVVGRLIVRRKSEGRTKNGSVLWICDCSCGNTVSVQSSTLNSGLKQSCGALKKRHAIPVGLLTEVRRQGNTILGCP